MELPVLAGDNYTGAGVHLLIKLYPDGRLHFDDRCSNSLITALRPLTE